MLKALQTNVRRGTKYEKYEYVRTYIHTYIHTHVRTYIHTYIHTHVRRYVPDKFQVLRDGF